MKKFLIILVALLPTLPGIPQKYYGHRYDLQKEYLNNKYCTGIFKSAEGTILDLSNETPGGYQNILDWMQGRVAGLKVVTNRNGIKIPVIRGSVAGIFIDEIPVDAFFLNSLSVFDIAMIKVIKEPFIGNIGLGIGAIAIYTYQGDEDESPSQNP